MLTSQSRCLIFLTPLFLWLTSFTYFVKFNSLPIVTPEFFCFLATILAASLFTSLLLWRAGWIRMALVLAFSLSCVLSVLPEFQQGIWLKLAFFTILITAIIIEKKALSFITFISAVFFVATLLFPVGKQFDQIKISQKSTTANSHLPLYIHLIFDEHMGVAAIPEQTKTTLQLKKEVTSFYPQYGFLLYTDAYSRYSRTYDSISNLLNFVPQVKDSYYFPGGALDQILKENADFKLLSQMGYQLRIYQPNYIDFCHAKEVNYSYCYSYPIFSFKYFYQLPISWQQRYQFILKSYLFSSSIYQEFLFIYAFDLTPVAQDMHLNLPRIGWNQNQLSTLATLQTLQQLKQDVLQHQQDGSAFFAHILLPHSPYIFNQHCEVNPKPMTWLINYDFGLQGNTPARRTLRYQLYAEQSLCLYKQLQTVFSAWQQAGILDKAIIIVQGDHSARLSVIAPTIENKDKSSKQDFEDAYPALFAVKAPFYQPGIDTSKVPITYLFGQIMQKLSGKSFPIDNAEPYVFLTDARPQSFSLQPKEALTSFK